MKCQQNLHTQIIGYHDKTMYFDNDLYHHDHAKIKKNKTNLDSANC